LSCSQYFASITCGSRGIRTWAAVRCSFFFSFFLSFSFFFFFFLPFCRAAFRIWCFIDVAKVTLAPASILSCSQYFASITCGSRGIRTWAAVRCSFFSFLFSFFFFFFFLPFWRAALRILWCFIGGANVLFAPARFCQPWNQFCASTTQGLRDIRTFLDFANVQGAPASILSCSQYFAFTTLGSRGIRTFLDFANVQGAPASILSCSQYFAFTTLGSRGIRTFLDFANVQGAPASILSCSQYFAFTTLGSRGIRTWAAGRCSFFFSFSFLSFFPFCRAAFRIGGANVLFAPARFCQPWNQFCASTTQGLRDIRTFLDFANVQGAPASILSCSQYFAFTTLGSRGIRTWAAVRCSCCFSN